MAVEGGVKNTHACRKHSGKGKLAQSIWSLMETSRGLKSSAPRNVTLKVTAQLLSQWHPAGSGGGQDLKKSCVFVRVSMHTGSEHLHWLRGGGGRRYTRECAHSVIKLTKHADKNPHV